MWKWKQQQPKRYQTLSLRHKKRQHTKKNDDDNDDEEKKNSFFDKKQDQPQIKWYGFITEFQFPSSSTTSLLPCVFFSRCAPKRRKSTHKKKKYKKSITCALGVLFCVTVKIRMNAFNFLKEILKKTNFKFFFTFQWKKTTILLNSVLFVLHKIIHDWNTKWKKIRHTLLDLITKITQIKIPRVHNLKKKKGEKQTENTTTEE